MIYIAITLLIISNIVTAIGWFREYKYLKYIYKLNSDLREDALETSRVYEKIIDDLRAKNKLLRSKGLKPRNKKLKIKSGE